ncbi:MAG: PEP-CTERM sorting domain-containing protein [Oxalobacteraceae bacterium]|nr:MAG: PEP-CTERM sorting domain-containing protein [Oxalobacteraceae bacterium]
MSKLQCRPSRILLSGRCRPDRPAGSAAASISNRSERRWLSSFACTLLPVFAVLLSAPDARAASLIQAGAYSQTQAGVGAQDKVTFGPNDLTFDVTADPYVVSRSGYRDERGVSQAETVARSAVQLAGADKADFFVSSSATAGLRPGASVGLPFAAHGSASGSAFYDFVVNTQSNLSLAFGAFASATPDANAYVALNLYSYDTHSYLRQGLVSGVGTESFIVGGGSYGFTLTAFSEATSPASLAIRDINGSAIANLSLTVSAVPEPASLALMLFGIGAVGTARRRWR